MRRFTTLVGAVALAVAACGGAASPTPIPATATPAATPAPVTASPAAVTASPAAFIEVKVTFDGTKCTYAGPATVPHGSTLVFTMENTTGGMVDGNGAALVVAPVVDGTTWEQILADPNAKKATDIPAWAVISGAGSDGLAEVESLLPESAALGTVLAMEMERNAYYVGCHTAPEKSNKGYPALLLQVLPG
jgi:hypothetical protein